ncbi:hypothetical protein INT46_010848, partial [Mucor plumbeus]
MRSILLFCLIIIFASSLTLAAEEGFTDFIIALSKPVTKDKLEKAKADIKKAGGKINHEITLGLEGFAVSLPADQITAFDQKDYIDFVEEDKSEKEPGLLVTHVENNAKTANLSVNSITQDDPTAETSNNNAG